MSYVRSPSLADVVDHGIQGAVGDVRVCLPGKVTSYDAARQSAHVQPLLRQTYVDEDDQEQSVAFPVVPNVPVIFPGAGGFRITFPLAVGDDVLLIFSDFSLDKYLTNGAVAPIDPIALHQHHLTDAIAIPGMHAFNRPWTGAGSPNMTLGMDGGAQVHITKTGVNLGEEAPPYAVALAEAVEDALTTLKKAIAEAAVTPADGGATLKTNIINALTTPLWPPSLGSTTVKVKG